MPISMLDWPEQSHTSPTSTSSNFTVFDPLTCSTCGPPAVIFGSVTFHSPRSFATARALLPPS